MGSFLHQTTSSVNRGTHQRPFNLIKSNISGDAAKYKVGMIKEAKRSAPFCARNMAPGKKARLFRVRFYGRSINLVVETKTDPAANM